MNFLIEESIIHLKAEIIAQDWRVSPKRAVMIEKSLSCLQQHFIDRKTTYAMLSMAKSVLEYIRNNKGAPPETIDFLKESMAHVVEQYENLQYDQKNEEKVFNALFRHFTLLKRLIKSGNKKAPKPEPKGQLKTEISTPIQTFPHKNPAKEEIYSEILSAKNSDTKKLINDLQLSLEKAGDLGITIGRIVHKLIGIQAFDEINAALSRNGHKEETSNQEGLKGNSNQANHHISCPPTECRQILICQTPIALRTNDIAATKDISSKKLAKYINNTKVPLTFFSRAFRGLSGQLKGPLSKISPRKLKKISLPIVYPTWHNMPEINENTKNKLLIVSNGNWHGIIACSLVDHPPMSMVKFIKETNGDITGLGYLEDETKISLLDTNAVLKREGFLLGP